MATASQISRLLKAAQFKRSESRKGRIKGLREHSEGFVTEQFTPDTVQVSHRRNSLTRSGSFKDDSREWATQYDALLTMHGFKTEVRQFGAGWVVWVTK